MRSKVRVSVVQFSPTWLEPDTNARRMTGFVEQEAAEGADLVVFPELANTGYITPVWPEELPSFGPTTSFTDFQINYIKSAEPIPGPTTDHLAEACKRHGTYVVVGMAQSHPNIPMTLYNSAALIGPNGVLGVYHKVHIAFNEKHYFYPGDNLEVYRSELGNIGITICYDGRFPEVSRVLALKGAEILCGLYASPWSSSDPHYLHFRSSTRAQENGVYYIACNRTGKEGETRFLGHSAVASPSGELIAYSNSDTEDAIRAELSENGLIEYRAKNSIFRDRRPELYLPITEPLSDPGRFPPGPKLPE